MEEKNFGEFVECGDHDDLDYINAMAVDLDCRFCDWDGGSLEERPIILLCSDENDVTYAFCPECRFELASSHTLREAEGA